MNERFRLLNIGNEKKKKKKKKKNSKMAYYCAKYLLSKIEYPVIIVYCMVTSQNDNHSHWRRKILNIGGQSIGIGRGYRGAIGVGYKPFQIN